MDRPGGTLLVVQSLVGAGPAIQRRSVMRRKQLGKFASRRLGHLLRLTLAIGIVPLLAVACYRSLVVIDHLDIQSGSTMFPSVRLGSGEGGVLFSVSSSKGADWSVKTWHDYSHCCRRLVLFLDVDTRGARIDVVVGYFAMI
jgi:hypothetical protein